MLVRKFLSKNNIDLVDALTLLSDNNAEDKKVLLKKQ